MPETKEENLIFIFMSFIFILLLVILVSADTTDTEVINKCTEHGMIILRDKVIECKIIGE